MSEKGRYLSIPREQRLRNACYETEDEVHFLDKCKKYGQIRFQLLNTIRVKLASYVTKPSELYPFNNIQNTVEEYVFECRSLST